MGNRNTILFKDTNSIGQNLTYETIPSGSIDYVPGFPLFGVLVL